MTSQNNKRIAKNTVFLYFRMLFTMGVTLYTSRVILKVLGVDDFGIYSVVGGIVGMLSFLNGALSSSSSRFITFELGANNKENLKRVFSTTLTIHIVLALLIFLLAETIGLWFLYNKLIIDPSRMSAAVFAYQISILTAVVNITQVPYNASIIAHERMSIYAYMSIFEVLAKLVIIYLLNIGGYDKLKMYALLLFIVQLIITILYRAYCNKNFEECKFRLFWDKKIVKSIASFSSWSLFSNLSYVFITQGANIITNMFFLPAVVGARAISMQVANAATSFVSNFRTAVNPQIVKLYADGNDEAYKKLLLDSTKYSFFLMYIISMPILLETPKMLSIWLGEIPEYTIIFVRLAIVQGLFSVFDISFYSVFYAIGRIKENAIFSSIAGFVAFLLSYLLFKLGCSPVSLSYVLVILYAILGLVIKPILINKLAGYTKKEIFSVFRVCFLVLISSLPVPFIVKHFFPGDSILNFVLNCSVAVISIIISVFFVGIDQPLRKKVIQYIVIRIKN